MNRNKCENCKEQLSYWQVWRSIWTYRLKCNHCGTQNSPGLDKRIVPATTVSLPLIVVLLLMNRNNSIPFMGLIAIYIVLVILFSLLFPLFKLYGE